MTPASRMPTWKERENNKRRERRRRAIAANIFTGLRTYGNYNLPKHCDNNEVLKALCYDAGWTVEADGTTYRKGSKPAERVNLNGRSTSVSPCSSYHPSPVTSYNPSPTSSTFPSPGSSSYAGHVNGDGNSLIPWLKNLSSGSSAKFHHLYHGGSISAPVTPPMSSPTCGTPRTAGWSGPNYPHLPLSTPPSPVHETQPGSVWFSGMQTPPSGPTSPTFSLVSSSPFGFKIPSFGSHMCTPGQSGTCSPAIPGGCDHTGDIPMAEVISDEFAFGSIKGGLVKAWEGERIHEESGSDELELTLGNSRTR